MDVMKEEPKNKKKKFDNKDGKLFKISAIAFALLAAKLWPPLLSLDWYWYAGAFALAMARPLYKAFFT